MHVAGQRAELRVDLAGHVPGDVVGADRQRLALGAPARRRSRRSRRPPGTPSRVVPQRARAEPHEDHVAGRAARRPRRRARAPSAPTACAGVAAPTSSSTPRATSGAIVSVPSAVKPVGRLHLRRRPRRRRAARTSSAWWQSASMCVPECSAITSSAEALVRASASPALVAAVQRQQHARLVRRPHRRAGVARLLEVVGPRARAARRERVTRRRELSPCVSGRSGSAAIAST